MLTLSNVSIVASFVAGIAALFAPCCISILLPSYLANIFKEKYKIFWMTFVFFLGILTVFLPLGLGAAFLAQFFRNFHNQIFTVGGVFLIALGISLLLGKSLRLPFSPASHFRPRAAGVYLLGIFSGIATTCCAPVLAGVIAISAINGTIVGGLIYTLAYVLGMVLPLFLIAALLDRVNLTQKLTGIQKKIEMKIGSKRWSVSFSEFVSGLVFLFMGGYIMYLAFNNQVYRHSEYQLEMNLLLNRINRLVSFIPQKIAAAVIIIVLIWLTVSFIKQLKNYDSKR